MSEADSAFQRQASELESGEHFEQSDRRYQTLLSVLPLMSHLQMPYWRCVRKRKCAENYDKLHNKFIFVKPQSAFL